MDGGAPGRSQKQRTRTKALPAKTGAGAFPESAHASRGEEEDGVGPCHRAGGCSQTAVLPRREPRSHPSLGSQGMTGHTELPQWLTLLTKTSEVITRGSGPQAAATEPLQEQRAQA